MANFCSNCRFPLAASASFCPQCGRQQAPAPAPPQFQAAAPLPPAANKGGGSAMKIVLIVVVCIAAFGVAAIAAGYYAFHKVKDAVVTKAQSYGVDLNNIPSPVPSATSSSTTAKIYKPCEILPKSDASNLLGEPIERTEIMDGACLYYGPAGLAVKLGQQDTSEMMAKAKAGAQLNGGDVADTVTKMLGAVAAQSGQNGAAGGEAPLLTLLVDADGRPQMTALAATKGIFGGIGAAGGGGGLGADIPNLGDRAIRLGPLGLNVLKGDTVIRIIVGPVPDAYNKSEAIARVVLPRI